MTRFLRFCVVGTLGFVVDAGLLAALADGLGMDPYLARVFSFLAAATVTWWLNRHYTFEARRAPSRAEWARYLLLMLLGAAINYGAYALAITFWDVARARLWIGVAIGSVAGLAVNFATSRALFASRG